MKLTISLFCLLITCISLSGEISSIKISMRSLGDEERAAKRNRNIVVSYLDELNKIREGMRSSMPTQPPEFQALFNPPLRALDTIVEQGDTNAAFDLLPFLDWLHANQDHQIAGLLGGEGVKGTLNYVVDGIFGAEMRGSPTAVDDRELEGMIRFYAGNPAQTSEGSWQTNNTMLFVFGDRLLEVLAKKVPDRIDAFHKAVLDARKSAQSGPGPDEEAIPDSDRPTAEQLQAYEATFVRLEALVATGALPESNLTSQADPTRASFRPHAVPRVRPPPKPSAKTKLSPTRSDQPTSSTPWSVIVILMAAAAGLAWVLLKKRK